MQQIALGHVLTPVTARDRGLELMRQVQDHSVKIILYREQGRGSDTYIVTVSHIVETLTTLERVGVWALLHS